MFAAATIAAEVAAPDGIELLDEWIDEDGIVGRMDARVHYPLTIGNNTPPEKRSMASL